MFSKATEYALRAVIFIARETHEGRRPGLDAIAEAIDSPRSFTAKILQQLTADHSIIQSVKGPPGGFFLHEKAKKLPVKSILKVMGEDAVLGKCVLGLYACSEKKPCPMHAQYKTIREQIMKLFETTTIGMLTTDEGKIRTVLHV